MTRIKVVKEVMESGAIMVVVASVMTFLSLVVWAWVALLAWPTMPIGLVMAYTWAIIWVAGTAYSVVDILDTP